MMKMYINNECYNEALKVYDLGFDLFGIIKLNNVCHLLAIKRFQYGLMRIK